MENSIWTGTSDTFNPGSAHKVIKPLVNLIVKELEKEAILPDSGRVIQPASQLEAT